MDEREFWRLVAEYLAAQQTSGGQWNPGGDLPYDDYGVDDQIGMSPDDADPNAYPYEDWGDTELGGVGAGTGGNLESATQPIGDTRLRYQGEPIAPGVSSNQVQSDQMAALLGQMEFGRNVAPMQGLFGNPNPPAPVPQYSAPQPVAAPTAQPVGVRAPQPSALQSGRQGARQVIQNLSAPRSRQYQAPAAPYIAPPAPRQAPAPAYQAPAQRNTSPARNVVRSVRRGIV